MTPQYTVSARIRKPVEEAFNAVADPVKLSAYFTTVGGVPGPLVPGATVFWWGKIGVNVIAVEPHSRIVLEWAGSGKGERIGIEMLFHPLEDGSSLVEISESGYGAGTDRLAETYSTCEGWTQMLCCLKAWLENGINLREGYFLSELSGEPTMETNAVYYARKGGL